jgi:hypothetical protein
MALTFGSIRHTPSGRKRKPLQRKTGRYTPVFEALSVTESYRRDTKEYKSAKPLYSTDSKDGCGIVDRSALIETSTHTIAPAYNKGAYQVISTENIKDIGR